MSKCLVSVVIPVYNSGVILERSLESVYLQSYKNIEVIVIDGGSVDSTINIIKKYESKISYWISERDGGIYDAMNKGLSAANGDYIYFLGSDDLMTRDGLFSVMSEISPSEKRLIVSDVLIEGKNKPTKPRFFKGHPMINHQAVIFNLHELKKDDMFYDLKYKIHSDYDFICRYHNVYGYVYIPVVLANFSASGISSRGDFVMRKISECLTIYFSHNGPLFSIGCVIHVVRPILHYIRNSKYMPLKGTSTSQLFL